MHRLSKEQLWQSSFCPPPEKRKIELVPFPRSNCKILIKRQGQRESGAAVGAIWDCGYASLVGEGRTPRGDVTGSLDWIRETGLNCTYQPPLLSWPVLCNVPPPHLCPSQETTHTTSCFSGLKIEKFRWCKHIKVFGCMKDAFVFKFNCFYLDKAYAVIKH